MTAVQVVISIDPASFRKQSSGFAVRAIVKQFFIILKLRGGSFLLTTNQPIQKPDPKMRRIGLFDCFNGSQVGSFPVCFV